VRAPAALDASSAMLPASAESSAVTTAVA
jgi:hypothetical protein